MRGKGGSAASFEGLRPYGHEACLPLKGASPLAPIAHAIGLSPYRFTIRLSLYKYIKGAAEAYLRYARVRLIP